MSLDKVLQYWEQINQRKQDIGRIEGRLDAVMHELQSKYGCKNIVDGRTKLKRLRHEADMARKKAQEKLRTFEKKWKEYLE
jgi:hypothetical protein